MRNVESVSRVRTIRPYRLASGIGLRLRGRVETRLRQSTSVELIKAERRRRDYLLPVGNLVRWYAGDPPSPRASCDGAGANGGLWRDSFLPVGQLVR